MPGEVHNRRAFCCGVRMHRICTGVDGEGGCRSNYRAQLSNQTKVQRYLFGHGKGATEIPSVMVLTVDVSAADQKPGDQRHDFHAPTFAQAI